VKSETQMVSEKYRFGGTPDAPAISVHDKLSMGDWKTGNAVYWDHLVQLAAYGILWEENHPDQPILGGYHLVRFSKDNPDFDHKFWGELEDAKEAFLLMRRLYDLKSCLEKRTG
jgi:hypothetical protein